MRFWIRIRRILKILDSDSTNLENPNLQKPYSRQQVIDKNFHSYTGTLYCIPNNYRT